MFPTRKSIKSKKKKYISFSPFFFIPFILPSFFFLLLLLLALPSLEEKHATINNMASFNRVTTTDIQNKELAIEKEKKQLMIMKLEKKIQEMESTLPGLKAQLKELKEYVGSSSSSLSPGESKTEASASMTEVSFISRGILFRGLFLFLV